MKRRCERCEWVNRGGKEEGKKKEANGSKNKVRVGNNQAEN